MIPVTRIPMVRISAIEVLRIIIPSVEKPTIAAPTWVGLENTGRLVMPSGIVPGLVILLPREGHVASHTRDSTKQHRIRCLHGEWMTTREGQGESPVRDV